MTKIAVGDVAPAFTLADADGHLVSLDDFKGKRVLLYVYPAAMTPGCTKQACDFRDDLRSFTAAGIQVIGLSPDSPDKLAKFREKESLPFPLLSDSSRQVLVHYGAYGEKKLYGKTVVGVIRSTFLISPDGIIEQAMYGVKATGHVAKLHRELGL